MKLFSDYNYNEKSGAWHLRIVATPENESEKVILSMARNECPQISENAHDSSSIEMNILLNRTE